MRVLLDNMMGVGGLERKAEDDCEGGFLKMGPASCLQPGLVSNESSLDFRIEEMELDALGAVEEAWEGQLGAGVAA